MKRHTAILSTAIYGESDGPADAPYNNPSLTIEKRIEGLQPLKPGQIKAVPITLKRDAFAYYHPLKKQWLVEPGIFEVWVGASSTDIRLTRIVVVKCNVNGINRGKTCRNT